MTYSIGEVSKRTGLSVHALRLYERENLLILPVTRDGGGRRVYTDADVAWIVNCRIFRASGMPLGTLAKLARLIRKGEGTERERLVVLREHQARITAHLADLQRARELIDAKVASYEKHLAAGTAAGLWVKPRA